nr:hypothetical protein [Salmonid herpesvirus 1]
MCTVYILLCWSVVVTLAMGIQQSPLGIKESGPMVSPQCPNTISTPTGPDGYCDTIHKAPMTTSPPESEEHVANEEYSSETVGYFYRDGKKIPLAEDESMYDTWALHGLDSV